ncbi:unnamed protein product [Ectocarpus sp. 6 AP-2014]
MSEALQPRMLAPEASDQWLWIVVVGAFGSFLAAFGIGANDVANAFATSVGARAVTLKQAIVLAGIFEFLGALLLGTHVTKAVRENIVDVECFLDNPGILMYGMMCVVYTTGMWLLLASYLELPVSTTHSTIGAIIGMTVAYAGSGCVVWYQESDIFPYFKGVAAIAVSWVLSPIFSGVASLLVFLTVRAFVLRSPNAFGRSFWVFPVLVMVTIAVNVFVFVYKGAKSIHLDETSVLISLGWGLGLGGSVALVLAPTVIPALRRRVLKIYGDGTRKILPEGNIGACDPEDLEGGRSRSGSRVGTVINKSLERDIHAYLDTYEEVVAIHSNAEQFDPRAEEVFKYVQVTSAICDAFAHGANDVANAMGPFEIICTVYIDGGIRTDRDLGAPGYLTLALGGCGIVAGLALYGHKIITAIGVKIAKITPSRGFSIEIGAALVMITGTRLGVPLSSTHCQVGATSGVALLEGLDGLNTRMVLKIIAGWAATTVICGVSCALLFAQGAYAPFAFDTEE